MRKICHSLGMLASIGLLLAGSVHASAQSCDQSLGPLMARLKLFDKTAPQQASVVRSEEERHKAAVAAKRDTVKDDMMRYMVTLGDCELVKDNADALTAITRQLTMPACKGPEAAAALQSMREMEGEVREFHQKCVAKAAGLEAALAARIAREK